MNFWQKSYYVPCCNRNEGVSRKRPTFLCSSLYFQADSEPGCDSLAMLSAWPPRSPFPALCRSWPILSATGKSQSRHCTSSSNFPWSPIETIDVTVTFVVRSVITRVLTNNHISYSLSNKTFFPGKWKLRASRTTLPLIHIRYTGRKWLGKTYSRYYNKIEKISSQEIYRKFINKYTFCN